MMRDTAVWNATNEILWISTAYKTGLLDSLHLTSSMLLHYNVIRPGASATIGHPFELDGSRRLVWATQFMVDELTTNATDTQVAALRMFVTSMSKLLTPGAEAFCESVFETHGHLVLFQNEASTYGQGYLRRKFDWQTTEVSEKAGSAADSTSSVRSSSSSSKPTSKKANSPLNFNMRQTHAGKPRGFKKFTVEGSKVDLFDWNDVSLLAKSQFGKCSRTFGVIDAMIHSHYVFQIASGKTPPMSWTQLVKLRKAIRTLTPVKIKFYFVVPPERFEDFRIGSWEWPERGEMPSKQEVDTVLSDFAFGVLRLYEVRNSLIIMTSELNIPILQ